MAQRRVLLIVGGGIAAYKSLELVRLCAKAGIGVRAVLTRAGAEFVTPLSLASLTGAKVHADLWSLTDEQEMGHIELSRSADLVVVAPATADLMGKFAGGLADDLASTLLLATDKPVLIAPAMNVRMWESAPVRRNLDTLRGDGVGVVGPNEGEMACGEFGFGRMAEPPEILAAVERMLGGGPAPLITPAPMPSATLTGAPATGSLFGPLSGRRALVTAGPTVERIDAVRFLSNRSSGLQGYAVASALAALGAQVTLVSGPTALPRPAGVTRIDVESAEDMLAACEAALPADVAVMVAAVADWRPVAPASGKIKKSVLAARGGSPDLELEETPDILQLLSEPGANRPTLVVGFAAETDDVETYARAKLARKGVRLDRRQRRLRRRDGRGEQRGDPLHPRRLRTLAPRPQGRDRAPPRRTDHLSPGRGRRMSPPVTVRLRRLPHADGIDAPAYATAGAAGLDLRAALPADASRTLAPGERAMIPTGFQIALPDGYEAQVRPRSGLAAKQGITCLNTPGTIDSDYRGEVSVILINLGQEPVVVSRGDRIAQMVIAPVSRAVFDEVATLDDTARGEGGFGSTGRG